MREKTRHCRRFSQRPFSASRSFTQRLQAAAVVAVARAVRAVRAAARAVARANAEWDSWYSSLPTNCKQGFDFNGFSYRVNPNTRTTTKQSIGSRNNDTRLQGADRSVNFSTLEINAELGI